MGFQPGFFWSSSVQSKTYLIGILSLEINIIAKSDYAQNKKLRKLKMWQEDVKDFF